MNAPIVALMRTAALPMAWFARAGAPELADALRQWDRDRDRLAADGLTLADAIGDVVVPHLALGAADRADALAARRLLHTLPDPIPPRAEGVVAAAADIAVRVGQTELGTRLRRTARTLTELADRHAHLDDAVDAEQRRLSELPWSVLATDPVARLAIAEAQPGVLADIQTRLGAGETWTGKRMRQRADLLWRLITRGSTRATPRGWLAHTALLQVADAPADVLPPLTDDYAVEYAANRHDGTGLAELTAPGALLAVTPLHRDIEADTLFWVIDPRTPDRLRRLRLRRTEPLRAVLDALTGSTLTLPQFTAALVPPHAEPVDRDQHQRIVHGFVQHLIRLGVVTVSLPTSATTTGWAPRTGTLPRPREGSFVDVHRRSDGPLPLAYVRRVEELSGSAMRVLDVVGSSRPRVTQTADLSETPRPVLDLMVDDLAEPPSPRRQRWDWPVPDVADTPYGRLHRWLSERLDVGPVDIDDTVLAMVGAPPSVPTAWPLDCVIVPVRPTGLPLAVFDYVRSTGTLDSRFADALAVLHPAGPVRPEWYRTFLRQVERDLGGRFVELLVPPLSAKAANAVRRPAYTEAWTGDPDVHRYYRDGLRRPSTYLPLSGLTIQRTDGGPVVRAHGERIWPVYHSTRAMPQPWDVIGNRLLAASPRANRVPWERLRYSLTGWPDRHWMPRITVGGGQLVLSPQQWRLRADELWETSAPAPGAARALARLRAVRGLPRWVTVAADAQDEPRACDLDSLHTVRLVDRIRRCGVTEFLVAEMLPEPDIAGGPTHRGELVLRLPLAADPAEMASRVRSG
ncbi:lantibiotic dehydratase [Kibdelosporangium persicum]|uniref:Lantibiotic dehydratase N-terminal domain-containing protein n=1 Tax=Kibdelosporangium persicum TaxID=2698649 RepID=A0ABX2FG77_9PSEU|nr:lantibiotic dehydratase [Kibdelosporangium persicum]NRN70406.1 hypothetical protein [Kibdelosporangium persicum]